MPFGFAVVPLVYRRYSRSSESIGSQGHEAGSVGCPSTRSFQVMSRPGVIGTSPRVRWPTTTLRTPGHDASASSAFRLSGTIVPRR